MLSTRPHSLRRLLGLLSLVLAVPMLALAVAVGTLQVRAAQTQLEAEALRDARQLMRLVDRVVADDLAALRRFARQRAGGETPVAMAAFHAATGLHLTLLDAAGSPTADTRATPLPSPSREAALALARSGGLVSPLAEDPESGGFALLLAEPTPAGMMVLALPAARLQALLAAPGAPRFDDRRFPAVVDAEGRIVARWRDAERLTGQPMPADARAAAAEQPDGLWRGRNLLGEAVLVAQVVSATTGMAVGVGITATAFDAPVWRSVLTLGPGVVLLLGFAGIATVVVARRIAGPVASLGAAAAALAEGKPPPRLATPVAEVNAVAEAMADAAAHRQAVEAQRDLLVRELHHRVKNLLTTAQSLATLSARSARDPAAFVAQFGDRLRALARTHTLLLEAPDGVLAFRALTREVVAPYRIGIGRISMEGPEVRLPADVAVPIGMVLHELATNALKYGALSVIEGKLDLHWQLEPRDGTPLLRVQWLERGGPPIVAPPAREGFGSQLLRRALAGLPEGKSEVTWRPEGIAIRMEFAVRRPKPEPATS